MIVLANLEEHPTDLRQQLRIVRTVGRQRDQLRLGARLFPDFQQEFDRLQARRPLPSGGILRPLAVNRAVKIPKRVRERLRLHGQARQFEVHSPAARLTLPKAEQISSRLVQAAGGR